MSTFKLTRFSKFPEHQRTETTSCKITSSMSKWFPQSNNLNWTCSELCRLDKFFFYTSSVILLCTVWYAPPNLRISQGSRIKIPIGMRDYEPTWMHVNPHTIFMHISTSSTRVQESTSLCITRPGLPRDMLREPEASHEIATEQHQTMYPVSTIFGAHLVNGELCSSRYWFRSCNLN